VLIEGRNRARLSHFVESDRVFRVEVDMLEEVYGEERELKGLNRSVVNQFERYVKLNKKIAPEIVGALSQVEDSSKLADTIASHLTLKIDDKQKLLEEISVAKRLELIYAFMEGEIEVLN